jgi:DNA polymerase-3 subunit epsilon
LHGNAEVVQIAIIDVTGAELLNTFCKPIRPIPHDATHIHGITDARVAQSPSFVELAPLLRELLSGLTCVVYNAAYDERLLEQSARAHNLTYEVPIFAADYVCAMEMYSQWVGDWSRYHRNYRWQPLPKGDHSALGDARACLAVLKRMAGEQ